MYEFTGDFGSFIVNEDHILCLRISNNDTIIEMSVKDLLDSKSNFYYLYDKNSNYFHFDIKKLDKDNFYGFELDKNNRYIMGNGIITHNSNGKSI